jgi:hypothetical protein
MQRHALNSAGANQSGQPGSADADAASASRDPRHAVKPDGTRHNRNTGAAHGPVAGTAHSNPDAGRACRKNLPKNPHRAGPRAARAPPQAPLAQQLPQATAAVLGNAGSARAAVVAHSRSHDSVVPRANAAKRGPHPGRADCSTDSADGMAGSVAHTPSAGKAANTCLGDVEEDSQIGHTQAGPRELLLPQVKSRRRGATRLRGVFIGTSPSAYQP